MTNPTLTINAERESEFNFDLLIRGTEESAAPTVRFVIEDVNGYDVSLNCSKTPDNRWNVKFPSLALLGETKEYRVEVITEGYFFCPVNGTMNIVRTPTVGVVEGFTPVSKNKQAARPDVSVKKLVEYAQMSTADKKEFAKQCGLSAKVLERSSALLRKVAESDQMASTVQSTALLKLLETVRNSLNSIQGRVYL